MGTEAFDHAAPGMTNCKGPEYRTRLNGFRR